MANGEAQVQGEKLQALIAGHCVNTSMVGSLTVEQRAAIESLEWSQVWAMREARQSTGEIANLFMI